MSGGNAIAWFTLAGSAVGVGLTGLFALATAVLSHRWAEKDQAQVASSKEVSYLRRSRKRIYAKYVENIAEVYQELNEIAEHPTYPQNAVKSQSFRKLVAEGERVRAELILMSGPEVLEAEGHYRAVQLELIRRIFAGEGFLSLKPQYLTLLATMRREVQGLAKLSK